MSHGREFNKHVWQLLWPCMISLLAGFEYFMVPSASQYSRMNAYAAYQVYIYLPPLPCHFSHLD